MIPTLFSLISFVGWGVGDVFGVITTRKIGPFSFVFWGSILGLIIYSLYVPFALSQLSNLTRGIFLLGLFLSLVMLISTVSFNKAFMSESSSLVGVISAAGFALVPILSISFLGEQISNLQTLAIAITFLGIFLSIYNFSEIKKKNFSVSRGIIWALVTMVCWGVYYSFIKIPIGEVGWFWPAYLYCFLSPLLLVFMKWQGIKLQMPFFHKASWPLLFNALLLSVGEFGYNFALSIGSASTVAPIAGAYPTLFVVLAFFIFKDPITKQQIGGVITTLIGIVLLSLFSV